MTGRKSSFRIVYRNGFKEEFFMERKVNVVEDLDGNKIVVIHDIRFKGRQSIEWKDVFI